MIGHALEAGRRMAETRMTEMVTVGRFEMVRPPGSLDAVRTLVETFYEGPARVKYPSASASVKNPAGQQIAETNIVVSLPAVSASVPTGALVRVDASASDSALAGRFFRVEGPAQAGQTTAHRYPVVEES
ncbi:hypothetical protein JD276_04455 [Leucobacter sp. CSA1]|uniref:Uncharacterized protein n=1 Tax=Leucobacter chromiisoli TaxID=2796471 RepID=A0A934Q837_9MICO|nr:DUF6093 family protein [Leucobacter chromiisoli]MBK0418282.1 hypothetical protein [Leucobacter chromiisoli]